MKISIALLDITQKGGGERVAVNLANLFATRHEVQVISYHKSQDSLPYPLDSRVKLHFLSHSTQKHKSPIIRLFLKHIYRYFLTLKARKIFKNDEIILANDRALAFFGKLRGKRYIRLWHISPKKKNLRFFDELVLLSKAQLPHWQSLHPSISIIPNFLPTLPARTTDHAQKQIICAGRFSKEKGFLRLIDIFAMIAPRFPQWRLLLVGEGEEKSAMQERIHAHSLQNQILIKPFNPNINEEFLQCSIYAMASTHEGFGMVLVESAACGLASVAFDIATGPSDIIIDKHTGFLIPDGDHRGFANALSTLMQEESLRQTMGQNARNHVAKEFASQKILTLWEELFSK